MQIQTGTSLANYAYSIKEEQKLSSNLKKKYYDVAITIKTSI